MTNGVITRGISCTVVTGKSGLMVVSGTSMVPRPLLPSGLWGQGEFEGCSCWARPWSLT